MTDNRLRLICMLIRAGVPSANVVMTGTIIVVSVTEGRFEVTIAVPPRKRSPRDPQWTVRRYVDDQLLWAVPHSSAGVVDQVRSDLFGKPFQLPDAPARRGVAAGWHRSTSRDGIKTGQLHRLKIGGRSHAKAICGRVLSRRRQAVPGDPGPVCPDCHDIDVCASALSAGAVPTT